MNTELQGKHDQLRTEVLTRILQTLAEQNRAEQELIQTTMRNATAQLAASMELLSRPPTPAWSRSAVASASAWKKVSRKPTRLSSA